MLFEISKTMFRLFILSLFLSCGLCFPPSKPANVSSDFVPRIINGQDANEGQFPFMVSLNYVGLTQYFGRSSKKLHYPHTCGASILTPNAVLTAAHCCEIKYDLITFVGSVHLGGLGQYHDIYEYVIHEDYDPNNNWRNDICIIFIKDTFQFNQNVQQVTLPPQGWAVNDGDLLTVISWEFAASGGSNVPDRLQVGYNFPALSNEHCAQETGVDMFGGYLCCGGQRGRGVCSGASGGPLMKDGVQVGITSWGFDPCGSGLPDFFTKVPHYITWIQQVLGREAKYLQFATN